jgi:hypothetical protein
MASRRRASSGSMASAQLKPVGVCVDILRSRSRTLRALPKFTMRKRLVGDSAAENALLAASLSPADLATSSSTSARASKAQRSAGNDASARHTVREPRPRDDCALLRSYLGRPRATPIAASRVVGRQAIARPLLRASPSWRVDARHKPATRPERRLWACVVVLEASGIVGGVEP